MNDHMHNGVATPARSAAYRWLVVLLLGFSYALSYADRNIVGILANPIKAELKLSDTELGLMGGLAFALFYAGLGIPIARLADRANRTRIIAASVVVWSACTSLCGMTTNFLQLFVARMGVGVGEAGGLAPSYSVISDYFPPLQRGRALSVFKLGIPVGSALGLAIGGYFAVHYGWRAAFVIAGVAGLLFAPVMLLVIREPRRGALDSVAAPKSDQTSFGEVLRVMVGKRSFIWLTFGACANSMMVYGLQFWLPVYFQRVRGFDLLETSQMMSWTTLVGGVVGMLAAGWMADHLGARNKAGYALVPVVSSILAILTLLLMMSIDGAAMLAMLFLLQALMMMTGSPSIVAIQNITPASMRVTASAIFLLAANLLGLGVGTAVFGFFSDLLAARAGSGSLSLAIIGISLLVYPLIAFLFVMGSRSLAKDWNS